VIFEGFTTVSCRPITFTVEKERFSVRTDPTQRKAAALALPILVGLYALLLTFGMSPSPFLGVVFVALIAVTFGWTPFPATIDARTQSFRIPGLSQTRIPLDAIRDVSCADNVVRIGWVDGRRGYRVRRVWPKEPEQFAAWVTSATSEAQQAA
jgi:hypothetical protein